MLCRRTSADAAARRQSERPGCRAGQQTAEAVRNPTARGSCGAAESAPRGVLSCPNGGFRWGAAMESEQTASACPACWRGGRGSHRWSQQGGFLISDFARRRDGLPGCIYMEPFLPSLLGPAGTQPHPVLLQSPSCTVLLVLAGKSKDPSSSTTPKKIRLTYLHLLTHTHTP